MQRLAGYIFLKASPQELMEPSGTRNWRFMPLVLVLGLCTVRKSRPHLSKTEIAKPGSKHLSMEQGASYIQLQMNEAIKR
jgi:hypothetical protein